MSWWMDLSPREKWLVGVAGGLFLIVFIWFALWRPVMTWRDSAESAYEAALRDQDIVIAAINSGRLDGQAPRRGEPFTRAVATSSAQRNGVNISRVEPAAGGALRLWFDEAQSGDYYRWVDDMVLQRGASIVRITVSRSSGGTISGDLIVELDE